MKNATVRARPKVLDERTRPRTIEVTQMGNFWDVDRRRVDSLGYSARVAASKRADFAAHLHQLGQIVASKAGDCDLPQELPDDAESILQLLAPALRLEEEDFVVSDQDGGYINLREEMRERGLFLFRELSESMRQTMQRKGVGQNIEDPSANPGVTFVVDETAEESQYPICWNMLYQADLDEDTDFQEADWHRFWGFLMPITQWLYESDPTEEIDIASSLLSFGEDEDLRYADVERHFLMTTVPGQHCDFGRKLREISQNLAATESGSHAPAPGPSESESPNWLEALLDDLFPEHSQRITNSPKWKIRALQHIFARNERYGLVHFACHCRPHKSAKRALNLSIGGELITIDEELILNHLRRKQATGEFDAQGPLVFLNACSTATAELNSLAELPVGWIKTQNAKAVIATICDMPDIFAYAFAVKFYSTLVGALKQSKEYWLEAKDTMRRLPQQDIAEALLETRLYFLNVFNNPLGLAYELYAVPDAYVLPSL